MQGDPNLISTSHTAKFNVAVPDDVFELDEGLEVEGERVDVSEMLVNKISDDVYHIGQNIGFTLFVNTSDGVVAAGGYPALTARYDRFKEESGVHKPLRYQIVTHHHNDHVGANLALKKRFKLEILGPDAEKANIPGIDRTLKHEEVDPQMESVVAAMQQNFNAEIRQ